MCGRKGRKINFKYNLQQYIRKNGIIIPMEINQTAQIFQIVVGSSIFPSRGNTSYIRDLEASEAL